MNVGDVRVWERTFTDEDVRLFARFSGDEGDHHLERDAQGRLMVHGLLTATLPTKIGGDMNFIARELTFQFHRPVFAGDTLEYATEVLDLRVSKGLPRYGLMVARITGTNQHGELAISFVSTSLLERRSVE